MNDRDAESLRWSWDYVARGLAGLLALLGWAGFAPSHMLRGAWRMANREMRYLEGMARRLLVAEAGALQPLPARAPSGPRKPDARPPRPRAPRAPRGFALIEPVPEAIFNCWFDDEDPPAPKDPWPCSAGAHPAVPAHALAARISALKSLLDAPEKAARRVARMLARHASPLCLARRRPVERGGTLDLKRSAFFEAERLALDVINRPFFATGPPA